jgi:hypothetical protein
MSHGAPNKSEDTSDLHALSLLPPVEVRTKGIRGLVFRQLLPIIQQEIKKGFPILNRSDSEDRLGRNFSVQKHRGAIPLIIAS